MKKRVYVKELLELGIQVTNEATSLPGCTAINFDIGRVHFRGLASDSIDGVYGLEISGDGEALLECFSDLVDLEGASEAIAEEKQNAKS